VLESRAGDIKGNLIVSGWLTLSSGSGEEYNTIEENDKR